MTSQVSIGKIMKQKDGERKTIGYCCQGERGEIFKVSEIRSISFLYIPFF